MSFLSLIFLFSLLNLAQSQSQSPRGVFIDCGATVASLIDGRQWLPDATYVSSGTAKNLTDPNVAPILSTVRSFPLQGNTNKKFCYVVPVFRTGKYMVRTTYYYGGVNGRDSPPVFDQIVDGTLWGIVNTTDDYARGLVSYYEGVFVAAGKTMSLCIAANTNTDSDPFISALEFVLLGDSLYNSTDFGQYGLSLVARHNFGHNGSIIRYPDDQFDRYWEPFVLSNPTVAILRNVPVSDFWNLPPVKVFETELTSSGMEPIEFQWPPASLPNSTYYIALYFADGLASWWSNKYNIDPAAGSDIGPLINAGEVFNLLRLGGRTLTRDVIALESVKKSLENPPHDWNGDPCFPSQYSWTGVTCSEGPRIRVVSLNLSNMGLSGSLSPSVANLTALTNIWLGNNSLSGSIPDLSSLKRLEILHLEDNQFSGEIPSSLGNIDSLQEL
ncbi:putative LRR receptor-like serine/threonine-protein kinase [Vitis vinifera]|uniref:Putative LRR receptor-like serine/threonine-protein kinase n=1 Tax=Vitis vinifera TaxID=29760 RepID=A0A438F6B0_VITVI|nr:putative LRR receptor-like serine/threonine-protein kinase [Vitis vinifera]